MSFDLKRWSRQSVALNTGALGLTLPSGAVTENGPAIFTYATSADPVDDVVAADYFANAAYDLAPGDLVMAKCSNGYISAEVTAVTRGDTPSVTIESRPLSGFAPIQSVDVTITSAQLLALRATPIQVVAAPGANRALHFMNAMLVYDWGTVAYTVSNPADDFVFRLKDASGVIVSADVPMTGFVDQVVDHVAKVDHLSTANVTAADWVNQALYLHNSGAGELTLGNGVLKLRVQYRVVSADLA